MAISSMDDAKPMTQEELHEIAVRRRGDAGVKALLLEDQAPAWRAGAGAHELAGYLVKPDAELTARQPVDADTGFI